MFIVNISEGWGTGNSFLMFLLLWDIFGNSTMKCSCCGQKPVANLFRNPPGYVFPDPSSLKLHTPVKKWLLKLNTHTHTHKKRRKVATIPSLGPPALPTSPIVEVHSFFQFNQFRRSVMYNSFQHHRLQHAMFPCPSPTPWACSYSCPSSQWCHPTISSSDHASTWISHRYTYHHCFSVPGTESNSLKLFHNHLWTARQFATFHKMF